MQCGCKLSGKLAFKLATAFLVNAQPTIPSNPCSNFGLAGLPVGTRIVGTDLVDNKVLIASFTAVVLPVPAAPTKQHDLPCATKDTNFCCSVFNIIPLLRSWIIDI